MTELINNKKILQTEVVKTEKGKQIEAEKVQQSNKKATPEEIEKKKIELQKKRDEYDKKVFAVGTGIELAKQLQNFIVNEAKWTYSESLGIVEVNKLLTEQIKAIESGKQKTIFLTTIGIEALHFFLKKVEGKGLASAKTYLNMLQPIGEALQKAQREYEKLQALEFELASLQHGIDVEGQSAKETSNVNAKK